jgi:hypothetical protein
MTAKRIIIDSVDVSGCPYYHGNDICKNTCHYFGSPCEWVDVQNCDYKQFNKLQAERDSYIDKYFIESQKVLSLRKVLKEIKALSERDKEFCIKCNGDKAIDCIECIEGGRALLAKEILQKISEVEDG